MGLILTRMYVRGIWRHKPPDIWFTFAAAWIFACAQFPNNTYADTAALFHCDRAFTSGNEFT